MLTYRRGRCRVRRYPGAKHVRRFGRRSISARNMVTVFTAEVNHDMGINVRVTLPTGRLCSLSNIGGRFPAPTTRGKHGRFSHSFEHGFIQSGTNDEVTLPSTSPQPDEDHNSPIVPSVSPQQTCRQLEPLLEPPRPSSDAIVAGIRRQLAPVTNCASILASRGGTSSAVAHNYSTVCREMGGRSQPSLESSSSMDLGYNDQDYRGESTGYHRSTQLARRPVVRDLTAAPATQTNHHSQRAERPLHVSASQSSLGVTTSRGRDSSATALQERTASLVPQTSAGRATVRLVDHCMGPSTDRTKKSQWAKLTRFCRQNGHRTLPTTEGTVLSYIGVVSEGGYSATVSGGTTCVPC